MNVLRLQNSYPKYQKKFNSSLISCHTFFECSTQSILSPVDLRLKIYFSSFFQNFSLNMMKAKLLCRL